MRKLGLFIVVLFLSTAGYSQVSSRKSAAGDLGISLTGRISSYSKQELKIKFQLCNKSRHSIYFAINPTQLYGESGYYVSIDKNKAAIKVSARVFPPPLFSVYMNKAGIELKKLNAGENAEGEIVLKSWVKQTQPPYEDSPYKNYTKGISLKEIKAIELTIGYFMEDDDLLSFLQTKPHGWYVNGVERLCTKDNKITSLLEIQNLSSVNIPVLNNKLH